jgi:hypothetical protein
MLARNRDKGQGGEEKQIRNPKNEIRNKFKIPNKTKIQNSEIFWNFLFRALDLFRISSFGFEIFN